MRRKDYTSLPIEQVTLEDRAVYDDIWISEFLLQAPYGVMATSRADQPFLHTTLFAFDPEARSIYVHGALETRKRFNVENNPKACFTAMEMGRLLPAETAMDFGVAYRSVVAFGRMVIVENVDEKQRALLMILDKYFPHLTPAIDYQGITEAEVGVTLVYRFDIEAWSGKQAHPGEQPPGSFFYPYPGHE